MSDDHGSLVGRATRGDAPAIESLLQRHLPGLRAFIRLRTGREIRDRESVSDLAQSVCREVLTHLDRFEYRGEAAFRGFLFAAALGKVKDRARYYRAQKRDLGREVRTRHPAGEATDARDDRLSGCYATMFTPSRVASAREQIALVEAAFDELPDHYREVLTLQRIAGISRAEIAERIGKSDAATRSLLERATRRLSWILTRGAPHGE